MSRDGTMSGKVSFDDIYDQPDPRAYFRTLGTLDYQIPEHARAPFRWLARRVQHDGRAPSFLDVCCSYGINATLLKFDLTMAALYARYRSPELDGLTSDELIAADRAFYAERRRRAVRVVGLDAAANAVRYGVRAGLLDAGSCENLEERDPSDELTRLIADVGLVTVTGGIGYITESTFDRVLGAVTGDRPPWVAAFSLRWVDMAPIGAVLERHGLTLEILPGRTFRQRRFADEGERRHAFAQLRRLGLTPEGVETDGYHHAAFYLARPRDDALAVPLGELFASVL